MGTVFPRNLTLRLGWGVLVCLLPAFARAGVDLSFGNTYSGDISLAGQEDRYTFTGTAGQRLYYDAVDYDFDMVIVQLIDPGGRIIFAPNSDTDFGPFTLTESGKYTVLQKGVGDYTNDYTFRLLDLAAAAR